MGADLFGSFAESTCAALVVAASSAAFKDGIADNYSAMMFPVLISSTGILVGIVTLCGVNFIWPVKEVKDIEKALKGVLVLSTVLETPVIMGLAYWAFPQTPFTIAENAENLTWVSCAVPCLVGAWSGLIIGFVTEYYTSHTYRPVREIAETQRVSAATGIIYGLALGYLSCVIPIFCLGVTILVSHSCAGFYGVALGALGMLSTMTMGLTIDVYGPISDNAGGIAEMSGLGADVRVLTDALDAAGNTTAAIGKGFAIGSAALVSLALFGAYCVRAEIHAVDILFSGGVNMLHPLTFAFLIIGGMIPFAFAAMTMKSVGIAAMEMVMEVQRQFDEKPHLLDANPSERPDYDACIAISTKASLKEMIPPGAMVILTPLLTGIFFGVYAVSGLLVGSLIASIQLAISMSNSGGAWDNAKKYIEQASPDSELKGKGSDVHKAAVMGDTVGDPFKDTSGPALNIVMKLMAVLSLVFADAFYACNKGAGVFQL